MLRIEMKTSFSFNTCNWFLFKIQLKSSISLNILVAKTVGTLLIMKMEIMINLKIKHSSFKHAENIKSA